MAISRTLASQLSLTLALVLVGTPLCTAEGVLFSGQKLTEGNSLESGSYKLIMQTDCNLVLYDSGKQSWATQTHGKGSGCYLTLESDANLVIYTDKHETVWEVGTHLGKGYYVFILLKDGRMISYGPYIFGDTTESSALPANKAADGSKASTVNMVVNN